MAADEKDELRSRIAALPDTPGVYLFKNEKDEIIYIGKALGLKSRVRSYFNEASWRERPKLAVMMPKVRSVDAILTNSEKEALLLEANLIRTHMPQYNVRLKDDRRYPWLAITYDVAFPRLVMVRDPVRYRKSNPRSRIFGPYVESGAMWETVKVLRKVFPMRQRKTPFFKDRPCMNYHIGLCLGPCQKLVDEETYDRMVEQVEMFLAGRQHEVVAQLKSDMAKASENLDYEQAARIRDRLKALETVIEKQQVFFQSKKVNQDVIAEAHTEKLIAICIMRIREGKLTSSDTICLPLTDRTLWDEAYGSFIEQYYAACEDVSTPSELLLQHRLPDEDENILAGLLTSKAAGTVKILVPQKGAKLDLIEMAKKNAQQNLARELLLKNPVQDAHKETVLTGMKEEMGLSRVPHRIECFDISNIQGTDNVASMVVFEHGSAKKGAYRTFKIQSVEGSPDDFASMREAVGRRYSRLLREGKSLPDLIVIDGGKGQLSAALEALAALESEGLDRDSFDIVGLAKKQEEIYFPGKSTPLLLSRRSEGLHLLQQVRNEAHRFAVTYHRKLRAKRSIASRLDTLKGVGKTRRKLLLDHFGSLDSMKKAALEELEAVPGLPKNVAREIFTSLNQSDSKPESGSERESSES
ncbi:MAG: excinuclease ABC subunit UvrC [Cyanobacteria bacterium HKST-UBA02]|nr:excinuclease ABC subunit UvrC [Cyanobacteria bacterium HKST-UBA02]